MCGELEEVTGDFGGAAHFAVQQDQRAGSFRVEWAAVEQIGQRPDGGQPVVQRVEYVGRPLIEDDRFDLRWCGASLGRKGGARRGRQGGLLLLSSKQIPDERADSRAEAERNPEAHAGKLCAARVCASSAVSRWVSDPHHGSA